MYGAPNRTVTCAQLGSEVILRKKLECVEVDSQYTTQDYENFFDNHAIEPFRSILMDIALPLKKNKLIRECGSFIIFLKKLCRF